MGMRYHRNWNHHQNKQSPYQDILLPFPSVFRLPDRLQSPLNAPTILAALELREFFTFYADASQLKNSKPDPEIFLAACAGLGVPPQACIGIEDAQAGIDAINASGMRSVGIGAGLTGAQLLLPSTESLTWPRLSAFWQNV